MLKLQYREQGVDIYGVHPLTPEDRASLVSLTVVPARSSRDGLSGRLEPRIVGLQDGTELLVKDYSRGGFLGSLGLRRYLSGALWGALPRPLIEASTLEEVAQRGIRCPRPMVAMVTRGLLYRGWLGTEFFRDTITLAELSTRDEERARTVMSDLAEQVRSLIHQRIHHVDLHPGNVLITSAGESVILDFDKAATYFGRPNGLRDLYLRRWRRAILKHELPEFLSELLSLGVRRNFDGEELLDACREGEPREP